MEISGDQRFPPPNLTHESEAASLADWLNQALQLNATIGPSRTPRPYYGNETFFFDGYNRTIHFPGNGTDFKDASGTVLSLFYAGPDQEFVALDLLFAVPRPMGPPNLQDYTASLAASLGIPLLNATYVEYSTRYAVECYNCTNSTQWRVLRHGLWLETRGPLRVDSANQLKVTEDADARGVLRVEAFRWIENVPGTSFTIDQIVRVTSDVVNRSYGARTFSDSGVGLTPNYQNLTWSFIVELTYPYGDGGSQWFDILLDVQTLALQRIEYHIATPSGGFLSPALLVATLLVAGVAVIVGVACLAVVRRRRVRGRLRGP